MSKNKNTLELKVPSLKADHIGSLFHAAFDPKISVTTASRALSSLAGDKIDKSASVTSYIKNYFMGYRSPLAHQVTLTDVEGLSPNETFDLFYRSGTLGGRESWIINRINAFINSHRVFAVAALIGHRKVMDCFLEIHGREWFGPLGDLVPLYDETSLSPTSYKISAEMSAKTIGQSFFLHSGTNAWNRAWLPTTRWDEDWDTHLRNWQGLIRKSTALADSFKVNAYQFLFVPEKDTLVRAGNPGLFQSGMLPILNILELMSAAPSKSVLFPVRDLITHIDPMVRLTIPDSHLSGQDYWLIFSKVMERFGLSHVTEAAKVSFSEVDFVGDLSSKFGVTGAKRQIIELDMRDAEQTYGEPTLQVPLRGNHVVFTNDHAPVQKSLLILGDSHASIGGNPFLTFIARHFFQTVEFSWSPFNVHNMSKSEFRKASYDYMLCETSQRFATPTVR